MTIHRFGNKEAALAGIGCVTCRIDEQVIRRTPNVKRVSDSEWEKRLNNIQAYSAGQADLDALTSGKTGKREADKQVKSHEHGHPEHVIYEYYFDKDHPLPDEDARTLSEVFGVADATSLSQSVSRLLNSASSK